MRTLLLLRHAKSSWDDPHLSDHARPLNMRGRQAAAKMAAALRQMPVQPELVMVSSARRTLQTLAALEPWAVPPRVEPTDALYLASASNLLDTLRDLPDELGCAMLVGHNPGLHDLGLLLAADDPESDHLVQRMAGGYPSGALAEFALPGSWRALGEGGARLVRFVRPADLSEVSA